MDKIVFFGEKDKGKSIPQTPYLIEKALGAKYSQLSSLARFLLVNLMGRLWISLQNSNKNFIDEENRAYIVYSNEDAMKNLNVSKNIPKKIFDELEAAGIIMRVKMGQGRNSRIYIKKMYVQDNETNTKHSGEKDEIQNPLMQDSGIPVQENQESPTMGPKESIRNNNNIYIKTDHSTQNRDVMSQIDKNIETIKLISYVRGSCFSLQSLANLRELVKNVIENPRQIISRKKVVSAKELQHSYRRLRYEHIKAFIDRWCEMENQNVKNEKAYITAALYEEVQSKIIMAA